MFGQQVGRARGEEGQRNPLIGAVGQLGGGAVAPYSDERPQAPLRMQAVGLGGDFRQVGVDGHVKVLFAEQVGQLIDATRGRPPPGFLFLSNVQFVHIPIAFIIFIPVHKTVSAT